MKCGLVFRIPFDFKLDTTFKLFLKPVSDADLLRAFVHNSWVACSVVFNWLAGRLREFRVSWILDIQWKNKALRINRLEALVVPGIKTAFGHVKCRLILSVDAVRFVSSSVKTVIEISFYYCHTLSFKFACIRSSAFLLTWGLTHVYEFFSTSVSIWVISSLMWRLSCCCLQFIL